MKYQEDNYIPQTIIIYLNPSDPSRTLQSGTIPQDAIVPGTSQEQQQHLILPKGCFSSLDYHLNTTGTHQNSTAPLVHYKIHGENSLRLYNIF